jgi:hypothetical protein
MSIGCLSTGVRWFFCTASQTSCSSAHLFIHTPFLLVMRLPFAQPARATHATPDAFSWWVTRVKTLAVYVHSSLYLSAWCGGGCTMAPMLASRISITFCALRWRRCTCCFLMPALFCLHCHAQAWMASLPFALWNYSVWAMVPMMALISFVLL